MSTIEIIIVAILAIACLIIFVGLLVEIFSIPQWPLNDLLKKYWKIKNK